MSTAYLVNTDTGDTTADYHSLLTLSSDIGVGISNDLAVLGGVDISCKAGTGVDDICVTGSYQNVFNSGAYVNDDATNFINLHSITPHNGSFSSGYRINIPSSAWSFTKVMGASQYQVIDGINFFIDPSRSNSGVHNFNISSVGGKNQTFKNCILDVPNEGIRVEGAGTRPYFLYNNIIKAAVRCVKVVNYSNPANPFRMYNNLFISSALGLETGTTDGTDGVLLENNVFLNCTTDVNDVGSAVAATTTNATTQATNSYGSIVNLSTVDGIEFVAPSTNDYHLVSGSSLIGAGTNLTTYLTTDIGGETWPSTGAWDIGADYYVVVSLFNDTVKQAILNGLTSTQTETLGWNNEVRDKESVTSVVRTSPTVVTITLSAAAAYNITVPEEITVTVPASALTGGVAIDGLPAFTVVALPSQTPCAQPASIPDHKLFMPELLIPGRKPVGNVRIDYTAPLAKHAENVFVNQGQSVVNLGRGDWKFTVVSGTSYTNNTIHGPLFNPPSDNTISTSFVPVAPPFTIYARCFRLGNYNGSSNRAFGYYSTAGDELNLLLGAYTHQVVARYNYGSIMQLSLDGGVGPGIKETLVNDLFMVCVADGDWTGYLYVNGHLQDSNTNATTVGGFSTYNRMQFGHAHASVPIPVEVGMHFSKALSQEETALLVGNPYQILIPA